MWKKIKIKKILLTSMIFAIGIIINIYIWYYISVQNRKDIIDSKLMYAASNIENLLPKDFHNKKMEKDDYYFDKLYRVFTRMDIEAKKMGVDYIYTFIKKKMKFIIHHYQEMMKKLEKILMLIIFIL